MVIYNGVGTHEYLWRCERIEVAQKDFLEELNVSELTAKDVQIKVDSTAAIVWKWKIYAKPKLIIFKFYYNFWYKIQTNTCYIKNFKRKNFSYLLDIHWQNAFYSLPFRQNITLTICIFSFRLLLLFLFFPSSSFLILLLSG